MFVTCGPLSVLHLLSLTIAGRYTMSLKNELLIYSSALEAFDTSNLSLALTHFGKISETSKIQWNMGIILATMGRHNEAIARFGESILMDQYLVVGWFQRGVSYFVSHLFLFLERF